MPASDTRSRAQLIADAALAVLAERGARGLTHRAVDAQAGLPAGSTSNVFRSKDALFDGLQERLVARELEGLGAAPPGDLTPEAVADLVAGFVCRALSPEREALTVARFELFLEARRRPSLRASVDGYRAAYTGLVAQLLAAAGVARSARLAPRLVALTDGLTTAGLLHPSTAPDDRAVREEIGQWLAASTRPAR